MWQSTFFKKHLRLPLILLGVGLVLMGTAYWLFDTQQQKLNQQLSVESRKLNSLVRQVDFLREQYRLYLQYGDKYQQLIKQGLAKVQDRVLWADVLLQERQHLLLNPLSIQFEPQNPLQQNELEQLKLPANIFYRTQVNLRGGSLLDSDILTVVTDVDRFISRYFLVKSCRIKDNRNGLMQQKYEFNLLSGNFSFDCSLVLFNSKPKPLKQVGHDSL